MRSVLPVLAMAVTLWSSHAYADEPKPNDGKSPAEQYAALDRGFETNQRESFETLNAAKTTLEKIGIVAKMSSSLNRYSERFLDLAKQHREDGAAVDALVWIVSHAAATPHALEALDQLRRDHLDSPKLAELCPHLLDTKPMEAMLRALMEKSPHREVRGQACFRLAELLANRAARKGGLLSGYARMFGRSGSTADPAEESEQLFHQVIDRYGDVKSGPATLGDRARGKIFALRNLAVGKVAPEIVGEDIDGRPFKLSDYRGKVVVLDFWGDW